MTTGTYSVVLGIALEHHVFLHDTYTK